MSCKRTRPNPYFINGCGELILVFKIKNYNVLSKLIAICLKSKYRRKIFMTSVKKQIMAGDEITVNISVTLGTADLRVHQLLKLGRGAVVELDRDVNDYVDIYANNILIGHGEVVITENETIGISITDIVKKSQR